MNTVEHIAGRTFHGRRGGPKGGPKNSFLYGVDYVLLDAEATPRAPWLFGRNRAAVFSVHDSDHGGPPKRGAGAAWLRAVLRTQGLDSAADGQVQLLTQPRVLGHVFNPVSFWLAHDRAGRLRVVVAEVTNTFGDRHSYLCHRDDLAPIRAEDRLTARKMLHVSPFQPVSGRYVFGFDIGADRLSIRIQYDAGDGGGLVATLAGPRAPLTAGAVLRACLRRPLGSLRVQALIHWQALKLALKGAGYRRRPAAPGREVSR